ncbi:MAG: biotin carboxylase N-terminal domain-containing protein [Roseobacter sp.]
MFDKILIANRGEIACRIMRTAQSMGIACVAVHSDVDAGALHVDLADQAVAIGGATPAESYLRGEAIIDAALHTGAQAIHPGYGFLSENPDFVDAVEAAGLVFIGPSAQAIRAMGLKDAAKSLMVEAGVPVVPGYHGADQDAVTLARAAGDIGYPVLIKAVAGGGGKGMRLVETPDEFASALEAARSEAKTAFGNSDVLVEKFVASPRHIEVQVFGDGVSAVHLFERDCSLQRRHQKVIEEAPAPGMSEDLRATMGAAAVRAAEAIGYAGAGTVEFIVDGSGDLRLDGFFFMEMNTRLQVEHPVTEAITGVDLVEWQLRVAAGAPLPARQQELSIDGHAFEARLYAEDVPVGFLPATGHLDHIAFPAGVRADSGVRAGDVISPFYDPMLAKLIVKGPTRRLALQQLRQALAGCEVAGTVTNLAFLGALAAHDGFALGAFDTGLIARDLDALTMRADPQPLHWIAAGMVALDLYAPAPDAGFTLWAPLTQYVSLTCGLVTHELSVEIRNARSQFWHVPGGSLLVERRGNDWQIDGRKMPQVHRAADVLTVFEGFGVLFELVRPGHAAQDVKDAGNVIVAPMPGLVKALAAQPGQEVQRGDRLAILEAMKMEHSLQAGRDGVVSQVLVAEGDQVQAGAALIILEKEEV